MKLPLSILAVCLPLYLFAQGFGSFSQDQPYFAKDRGGFDGVLCDTNWNPALSNANLYALYDFNCLNLSDGTIITNVPSLGTLSATLISTNGPYYTNNVAEINNRGYGRFNANYLMGSAGFSDNPETVFIVMQDLPNPNAIEHVIFDNSNNNIQPGGRKQLLFSYSGGVYEYGGVSGFEIQAGPYTQATNWIVTEMYLNGPADGSGSYVKTNNITAMSGTWGPSRIQGITLGANGNYGQNGDCKIAWAAWFTTALDATTRSNIFWYLTNRFNISP